MPEPEYSNREIDRMFSEIKSLLVDIKEQTTKTNGRVTKLEFWKEGVVGRLVGGVAVITIGVEIFSKLFFK